MKLIDVDRKPRSLSTKRSDSFDSDSDVSKSEAGGTVGDDAIATEMKLQPEKWENLDVPDDLKNCFQYIIKYIPQNISVDYHLQPFIPEYVPAVGDVDAFLNIKSPECINVKKQQQVLDFHQKLGLMILDEPSGQQSEPSLLQVKLRSVLMNAKSTNIQPIVGRTSKEIDKWITEISEMHLMQVQKVSNQLLSTNDIDTLMTEWPGNFEQHLNKIGFPSPKLDCPLSFYVKLVCSLFDIPIKDDSHSSYVVALSTLFNLYLAISSDRNDFKEPSLHQ